MSQLEPRQLRNPVGTLFLWATATRPTTIDEVRLALRGLSHRMQVEVETGIPLAAHIVADLRARNTWPPGLQLIVPDEPDRPASAVSVERRK